MTQGDVEPLVDVDEALLLHVREDHGRLHMFPRCLLCLPEFLLKPSELSQLHLDLLLLLLLGEIISCLLLGGSSSLITTKTEREKLRDKEERNRSKVDLQLKHGVR